MQKSSQINCVTFKTKQVQFIHFWQFFSLFSFKQFIFTSCWNWEWVCFRKILKIVAQNLSISYPTSGNTSVNGDNCGKWKWVILHWTKISGKTWLTYFLCLFIYRTSYIIRSLIKSIILLVIFQFIDDWLEFGTSFI